MENIFHRDIIMIFGGIMENVRAEPLLDRPAQQTQSPSNRISDTQRMLIEQRISNDKPSAGVAYLLCLFLGAWGGHRFYLGHKGSAIAMLLIGLTFIGLIITGIWAFIDLFLISGMIREKIDTMRQKLTLELIA